jgi:hypothetical protein
MRRKQTGVTFIGWICLLIPVAIVGYAGIRLAPIYMNYGRVTRSMEQVAKEAQTDASTGSINPQAVKISLEKRLDIEGIQYPDVKDFVVRRDGKGFFLDINYEEPAPLFANVSLLVTFQKSVPIGGPGD